MSRLRAALTLTVVFGLMAAGLASPLLPFAAGAPYGSHVFEANPLVPSNAQSYPVYSGSTVAQSFAVDQTHFLENVTLRVVNNGSSVNALTVSIHPDDPTTHLPQLGTTLASWSEVTPNNNPSPINASWAFNPAPLLQAGQTYWIVAANSAPQAGNGYQWFSTNGDTYGDGHALLDSSSGWSGLPYDLYFVNYGQEYDANVTPALTSDHAQAQPGDFVTFHVYLNNTGARAARQVWVNDTLPDALANVSLSFPGVQPVSAAAFPNLTFANVSNGAHSFTVTVEVAIGTPPGTTLTSTVDLAFLNDSGEVVEAGSASASVVVGLVTKQLYMAGSAPGTLTTTTPTASTPQTVSLPPGASSTFTLAPALAGPLHVLNITTTLWLRCVKIPPQKYVLNLTLTDNGTAVASVVTTFQIKVSGYSAYRFSFPLSDHTFGTGHEIGLTIASAGGGTGSADTLVVAYNSTGNAAHLDLLTDTYVVVRTLALGNQAGPTSTWAPQDSLVVSANVSDPFGRSRIAGVWVNITDPSGHLAAAGAMSVILTDPSSLPAWELTSYTLAPPLATGEYRVVVTAMEDNGVRTFAQATAHVAVPSFSLSNVPAPDRAQYGQPVAFYIWFNNTGTGPAPQVWINDTLPAAVTFVTSSLPVTTVIGSRYTWALSNISIGPNLLEVDTVVSGASSAWFQASATLEGEDTSGHSLPTAYGNASVFLNGPIIAVALSSLPSGTVHANESVTYTVSLANAGQAAGTIWVNDTLPSSFTFQSTTATLLGGTLSFSGSTIGILFSNLPANTTWRFDLVAQAGSPLVRGTSFPNVVTVAYTSGGGVLMPGASANLSVTAIAPSFPWAAVNFLQNQVLPGAVVPAQVAFANLGSEGATNTWVNLTLDPRLSILNASRAYVAGGGTVAFDLGSVGLGLSSFFLNVTVATSASDRDLLTILGTLDAHDGIGNPLALVPLNQTSAIVHAVEMSLVVSPQTPSLEAGVPFTFSISAFNWGSDVASNAWLNTTLPPSLQYLNDSFPTPPAVSGSDYSWRLSNFPPGSVTLQLNVTPRIATTNGTPFTIPFTFAYQGSNNASLSNLSEAVSGRIVAPELTLEVASNEADVVSGGTLVYSVLLTNTGAATAESVSLVDTLDTRLQGHYYDASVSAVQDNQTYNWTFVDLAPGQTQSVNLTVHVAGNVASNTVIPNVFEVTYTNSLGLPIGRVRSTPATVTVTADLSIYGYIGLGAGVIAVALILVQRRKRVDIEEVFLVYRDGVLISHLSRTLLQEKDEDVLSGMLTAVQEFVREAFQYGEHRDLHQMDFGDYRILIERGKYVFLAIVYSGRESLAIRKKVRAVLQKIETQFGDALEKWDGDMEQVVGARDLIRDSLLGSGNHNHLAKAAPEDE